MASGTGGVAGACGTNSVGSSSCYGCLAYGGTRDVGLGGAAIDAE